MSKISEIKILVHLDDKNIPEKIVWSATDTDIEGVKIADAMSFTLWDKDENITLGIDLWTKEMLLNNMYTFVQQNLLKLADMLQRATNNFNAAEIIRKSSDELKKILDSSRP